MGMKSYYIKERRNPQLGTYFVSCGQLSKKEARSYEKNSVYGSNIMHAFSSEQECNDELTSLKNRGEKVQS